VADSGHLIAEMQQQLTAFEIVQEIAVTSIRLNVPLLKLGCFATMQVVC